MDDRNGSKKLTRVLPRVLAVLLVVALVFTGILYSAVDVSLNAQNMKDQASSVAAAQLLLNDRYANRSRLGRMSYFVRDLLNTSSNYDDFELGASIAIARENYEDAIACTDQSIRLYSGDDRGLGALYLRQGYLYTLMGKDQEALDWLNRGIVLNPIAEAYLTRAQIKLDMDDVESALTDVRQYVGASKDAMNMLPNLVNVFTAAGDYETAAGYYSKLLSDENFRNNDYYLCRAYCNLNLGKMDQAQADCEAYRKGNSTDAGASWILLGTGWLNQGEYEKANDCFDQAIEVGYAQPEALLYDRLYCAYMLKDTENARNLGDQAIQCYLGNGALDAVEWVLSESGVPAIRLTSADISSLCTMAGAAHIDDDTYAEIADDLATSLQKAGASVSDRYLYGSCLLVAGRYSEAIVEFDAAIAEGVDLEKSHYGRGVCKAQLKDNEGALDDFDWVLLNGTDETLFDTAYALTSSILQSTQNETVQTPPVGEEEPNSIVTQDSVQ